MTDEQTPEQTEQSTPRRRGKLDPTRPPEFDATDQDAVAAYIEEHGFDAFREERNRQTGYRVGDAAK